MVYVRRTALNMYKIKYYTNTCLVLYTRPKHVIRFTNLSFFPIFIKWHHIWLVVFQTSAISSPVYTTLTTVRVTSSDTDLTAAEQNQNDTIDSVIATAMSEKKTKTVKSGAAVGQQPKRRRASSSRKTTPAKSVNTKVSIKPGRFSKWKCNCISLLMSIWIYSFDSNLFQTSKCSVGTDTPTSQSYMANSSG